MGSRHPRSRAGSIGVIAMLATALSVGAALAQTPGSSPSATPMDPDAIVLTGRIVGSNAGMWRELPRTDFATQVTMDVTMTLTPRRAFIEGTAMVSGSYSGDCQFGHEESVPILSDSNDPNLRPSPDPTSTRPAFALVGVYTSDPRFPERPLEGFAMNAGAGTGTVGGICGYLTGRTYPIEEVESALSIDVMSCDFLDILSLGDAYTGSCTDTANLGRVAIDWTASFEEVFP